MLNRIPKSLRVITILIISILPFGVIKTDYYFMSPGPPYQWDIEIVGANSYEFEGNLYQLTVRRDEANSVSYTHLTLPTNREV